MQIMLRTKQIVPLSQCARSFFISGSQGSKADGSSSTCTEDETCVSRKQQRCNEGLLLPKTSALVPKTLGKSGTLLSGDSIGYQKAENGVYPASVARILPAQSDMVHSSALVANHAIKASIAAVGSLSDLVNYKLPISDANGVFLTPKHYTVDSTRSIANVRSSNTKAHERENFSKAQRKPSVEVVGWSNSTTSHHGPKGQNEKSSSAVDTHNVPSDTLDKRQSIPHRSQTNSYRFVPKSKSSGRATGTGGIVEVSRSADNVPKLPKSSRIQTRTPALARPSINAGHGVERVYHTLQHLKWGLSAEKALENLNCSLTAYQANQILKQLQDDSVALGFFYWLKRQPGFKHDGHSYTTMVGILGRARRFGAINTLLNEMVRDGCLPNVVTYNRLIHSYGRANYMDEAISVFYQMQEMGCEPDRVTYCTLIDVHAKAGFLDVAMNMYRRMQEAGLSPDTFTYSVIINCLGKAGHLAAAYDLFCDMVSRGCAPNLVTYNIMITLQAKARNYPCALKLYRDMQTVGFQPDKVTYSIVMEVLGHCGYLDEAEVLFAEMKRKNWIPDEPVYGLLVDLWGKSGNVDKAQGWYQMMLDAGLYPNVPTCNSLLSAFLRIHRFSDAYDMLQSMLRLDLHPSLQTYTLILSCCTDTRSHGDMGYCCELMASTGHPAHAFLLSMPAAGPDGQNVRDHVSDFLDLMRCEDRESKRGLVDAVIDFLHKSGLKEEASSVWEVAAQKNVYTDVVTEKSSCYWLINLHVMSDGTAVTALSRTLAWFRRQMLASGIRPSRIDIVTGWGRRSKVMGSSLVRQSVKELLNIFNFPFFTENGNSGCFVGCGKPLNTWLLHSYVERMHLL